MSTCKAALLKGGANLPRLMCYFLGSFRIVLDGKTVTRFESDKVRALLAYLLIEWDRPHRRDALAALLWPEQPDQAARQNLRQALYGLRQTLSGADRPLATTEAASPQPLLLVTPQTMQFNAGSDSWTDVAQFKALVSASEGHDHRAAPVCPNCVEGLQEAIKLYSGDFLEGFSVEESTPFEEWLVVEREFLHRHMIWALTQLAAHYEEGGYHEQALKYVRRQLKLEPWKEEAHRQAMRLLSRTGGHAAALAQYETCRLALAKELDVAPSRETTALYERIRDSAQEGPIDKHDRQVGVSNLPARLSPFIGREAEVSAIAELLLRPQVRLLTVTGPGGVGKTSVASQVAIALADRFGDGVFFVDLAPINDPAFVLPQLAQSLGVKETARQPLLVSLAAHLRDKEMLLFLDNFEQVVDASPLLAELVGATKRLKALVTSREALRLRGAQEFPLPPMSIPDRDYPPPLERLAEYEALRLFAERASALAPHFTLTLENAGAVAEICRRLDGLPLAIELAAARIKVLPPQAMLARLSGAEQVAPLLLEGKDRDVPARQRTLRRTIEWSYNLLTPPEQAMFRRMAVFVGGCTLGAAESVCGAQKDDGVGTTGAIFAEGVQGTGDVPPIDALDALAGLVDKSLVRQVSQVSIVDKDQRGQAAREARFTMLQTIREYALERLKESSEAETLYARHASYYLTLTEAKEQESKREEIVRFEQFKLEYENLRAAHEWLLSRGWLEADGRLAAGLGYFWDICGYWSEGRRWLHTLLADEQRLDPTIRANLLRHAGWLAMRQNDTEGASLYLEKSLALFRELALHLRSAATLTNLGVVALYTGEYARAREVLEEAEMLYRRIEEEEGASQTASILIVLGNLATIALFQGDYAKARALSEEVLVREQAEEPDYRVRAQTLATLGAALLAQGDLGRAESLLKEGLLTAQRSNYTLMLLYCLAVLAATLGLQGHTERGARYFGAFNAHIHKLGSPLPPGFQTFYGQQVASVRALMDAAAWESSFAAGGALTLEEVTEEAVL